MSESLDDARARADFHSKVNKIGRGYARRCLECGATGELLEMELCPGCFDAQLRREAVDGPKYPLPEGTFI